jgi:hypothetical protein
MLFRICFYFCSTVNKHKSALSLMYSTWFADHPRVRQVGHKEWLVSPKARISQPRNRPDEFGLLNGGKRQQRDAYEWRLVKKPHALADQFRL